MLFKNLSLILIVDEKMFSICKKKYMDVYTFARTELGTVIHNIKKKES